MAAGLRVAPEGALGARFPVRLAATAVTGLPALAARLRGKAPILRETALLVGDSLTAHAGDLPLPLRIHRGKAPIGRTALRGASVMT